ncbi:MAG: glycoside hydrolase family 1 protein [Anaerolineae bacterium]|nr:glycoside hydrolase family 1 protein [Anaerolineae bacterium]
MPKATFHFPPDFLWGVATASHQVEGHNTNNQWWAWEQQEGRIKQGGVSGMACNWWENAELDFDRAEAMGLNTLRLSIEWSRVEVAPSRIDTAALDRYREMVRGLHARGIEPMVTLHHFSDPLWFAEQGGWLNENAVAYFTRYVEQVVKALGDEVTLWCTINEPNVYTVLGYVLGDFPPGIQDQRQAYRVLRAMLKAHAAAYRRIHQLQVKARVGLAHNYRFFDPYNPRSPRDRWVARIQDLGYNQSVLNPLLKGTWSLPVGVGFAWGLRRKLDWLGLNYYTRDLIQFDKEARAKFFGRATHAPDAELLDGNYGELYPEGMFRMLKKFAYMGLPLYITENGIPDADDDQRPRALLLHLHQMWRALQENMPVKGYYHWTLTDNFEWAEGWTLRFGLIELDPETQERTLRPSANLYSAIARGNAITPEILNAYVPVLRSELFPE